MYRSNDGGVARPVREQLPLPAGHFSSGRPDGPSLATRPRPFIGSGSGILHPVAIPAWDYRAEYEAERDDIWRPSSRCIAVGTPDSRRAGRTFEQEFASYWAWARRRRQQRHGRAVLRLGRSICGGDEVITTSNTAIPTVAAIVSAGGTPRFVDIEPETYLMDVSQLESAITPRTRCIVPVHLFGQCVDMDAVQAVAARQGTVIEDCAQSTGADTGAGVPAPCPGCRPSRSIPRRSSAARRRRHGCDARRGSGGAARRLRVYGTDGRLCRGARVQLTARRGARRDPARSSDG